MSDKLITEIPLIGRYTRHNEAQDMRFRSYLKASPMSSERLDAIVQETTNEVWAQIDCLSCANCCRTLKIVVDAKDIKRLSERLGVSVRQFTEKYVEKDKVDGELLFKATPCAFLGSDNRCTVYEDRPAACRDFPYLHSTNFRGRTFMMIANCETCPIVFNVWQALKARFWPKKR